MLLVTKGSLVLYVTILFFGVKNYNSVFLQVWAL
jgi:hypothetical protein